MEQINFNILIIITSGISLIMGLYMFFLYRSTSGVKATSYWATGSLVIGAGLLFYFVPPVEGFIAIAAPPLFVSIGLYFYLTGIWQFKEKIVIKRIVIGIPLLDIIQSIFFFQIFPSHRIRLGLHSIFLIIYCLIAIYEMLKLPPGKKYLQSIFRLNAFTFIIYLCVLLVSGAAIVSNPNFDPLQISEVGIAIFILSGFIMIALTFGFLSAVNLQLYSDLESQLKSKTKFFAIIAHDLRNPIGTIMNFLNLLNNEPDLKEEERKIFLQRIELLSKSTVHLLQNLFEWATTSKDITDFEKELIELNQLVASNIDFFKSLTDFKSIDLEFKPGEETLINGNTKMLETVLRNLVSNAVKFTPKGGKITITTQNRLNKVRLAVADSGVGIDPKKLNSLFSFDKSKSTSGTEGESGSGFGLVLCKEFLKKNNGTFHIESRLNVGTNIIIEFPSAN